MNECSPDPIVRICVSPGSTTSATVPAGTVTSMVAALVRASDRPEVRETLQSFTQELFANRLSPRLAGDDRLLRAHLFAAGMTGIQVALWVGEDPVLSGADIDEVIARYAPSLQLLLTPG